MKRSLIFRPEAERDLEEALNWHEKQIDGLGSEFLLSVDACIESILRNPVAYPVAYRSVRRALLKRFPYGVFYSATARNIVVLAVLHARRNPELRMGRA